MAALTATGERDTMNANANTNIDVVSGALYLALVDAGLAPLDINAGLSHVATPGEAQFWTDQLLTSWKVSTTGAPGGCADLEGLGWALLRAAAAVQKALGGKVKPGLALGGAGYLTRFQKYLSLPYGEIERLMGATATAAK